MAILHLVRSSAFSQSDLAQCLSLAQKSDTIILCDEGCYNVSHPLITKRLAEAVKPLFKIILLHAQARAVTIPLAIEPIEMSALINLTFTHDKVITWQ